jgi:hypothetical protein
MPKPREPASGRPNEIDSGAVLAGIGKAVRSCSVSSECETEAVRLTNVLLEIHARQWELEDEAHRPEATDPELGLVKRAIDESNANRVKCINGLDMLFADSPTRTLGDRLALPLTVGQFIDLLAVSATRSRHTQRPIDRALLEHGLRSFSAVMALLASGTVELPPATTNKEYATNARSPLTTPRIATNGVAEPTSLSNWPSEASNEST